MRLTRKCPEGAAVAALRDIDAVTKSTGQRADELISVSLTSGFQKSFHIKVKILTV